MSTPLSHPERFEQFCEENPHVYDHLVELALDYKNGTGRDRLSIKTLWERLRWEYAFTTTDEDYKLNNNYHAFYARLMMLIEPELRDFFVTRSAEGDRWLAAPTSATMLRVIARIQASRNGGS